MPIFLTTVIFIISNIWYRIILYKCLFQPKNYCYLSNVVCGTNNMIEKSIKYSYMYSSDYESSVISYSSTMIVITIFIEGQKITVLFCCGNLNFFPVNAISNSMCVTVIMQIPSNKEYYHPSIYLGDKINYLPKIVTKPFRLAEWILPDSQYIQFSFSDVIHMFCIHLRMQSVCVAMRSLLFFRWTKCILFSVLH